MKSLLICLAAILVLALFLWSYNERGFNEESGTTTTDNSGNRKSRTTSGAAHRAPKAKWSSKINAKRKGGGSMLLVEYDLSTEPANNLVEGRELGAVLSEVLPPDFIREAPSDLKYTICFRSIQGAPSPSAIELQFLRTNGPYEVIRPGWQRVATVATPGVVRKDVPEGVTTAEYKTVINLINLNQKPGCIRIPLADILREMGNVGQDEDVIVSLSFQYGLLPDTPRGSVEVGGMFNGLMAYHTGALVIDNSRTPSKEFMNGTLLGRFDLNNEARQFEIAELLVSDSFRVTTSKSGNITTGIIKQVGKEALFAADDIRRVMRIPEMGMEGPRYRFVLKDGRKVVGNIGYAIPIAANKKAALPNGRALVDEFVVLAKTDEGKQQEYLISDRKNIGFEVKLKE